MARATPWLRSSRPVSEAGRTEDVGSDTPDWNTPRSDPPRWTNPAAVLRKPCVNDSSATIVATPTAIPEAVKRLRAGRRTRLAEMMASTACPQRAESGVSEVASIAPSTSVTVRFARAPTERS